MTTHEPAPGEPTSALPNDPVAALRAAVDQVLGPVEQKLDEWETGLLRAVVSPRWTPLIKQQMAELRAKTRRCRELGDAMTAAAAGLEISPPPSGDSSTELPSSDHSPGSAPE
jgi:hypothetical protein